MCISNFMMASRLTLISLLFSSTLCITPAEALSIPSESAILCPVRWCDSPKTDFLCPRNDGSYFWGTHDATCDNRTTELFSHPGAHTTVALYQTNETWQSSPSRDAVLTALHSAITDSLALFGTHAGTPDLPLIIRATVSLDGPWSRPVSARTPVLWQVAATQSFKSPSHGNKCHLSIVFPLEPTPLHIHQLQRHLIRNLYYCVIQYHHPKMSWFTGFGLINDNSPRIEQSPWWRTGIANFFATSLRPTTSEDLAVREDFQVLYPEEYSGYSQLTEMTMTCAIIWHWAVQAGWTVERVSKWMVGLKDEIGMEMFTRDGEFRELFHGFARAHVEGGIRYSLGNRAIVPVRKGTDMRWRTWRVLDVVELETAEDIVVVNPVGGGPRLDLQPWTVNVVEVPIGRGQVVNASMGLGDTMWHWKDGERSLTEEEREKMAGDLQWSYRRKGTVELTRVPQAGAESWAMISTESAENETLSKRQEPVVFEFLVTVTGNYHEVAILFKLRPGII